MSHGGKASGTGASRISTKPSGSTRAMFACSPSTRFPISYLRRFPEALRKFDQVLNITPDDLDTLVEKAAIAQAEGDLPRACGAPGSAPPERRRHPMRWKHKFTKRSWSAALHKSFLG